MNENLRKNKAVRYLLIWRKKRAFRRNWQDSSSTVPSRGAAFLNAVGLLALSDIWKSADASSFWVLCSRYVNTFSPHHYAICSKRSCGWHAYSVPRLLPHESGRLMNCFGTTLTSRLGMTKNYHHLFVSRRDLHHFFPNTFCAAQ